MCLQILEAITMNEYDLRWRPQKGDPNTVEPLPLKGYLLYKNPLYVCPNAPVVPKIHLK